MSDATGHEARLVGIFGRFGIAEDVVRAGRTGGPLVPAESHFDLAAALKEAGWRLYVTTVASHWPAAKSEAGAAPADQFEVGTALRTIGRDSHVATWRVRLEAGQEIDSLTALFAGADWQEREQFDLVGVRFRGHPDLRRIMMPDEWTGHPLRKDYAIETGCEPWR
ncbi:MAG: NADH-quinone oxidoreductase subunit C [Myxococcota bacterium]